MQKIRDWSIAASEISVVENAKRDIITASAGCVAVDQILDNCGGRIIYKDSSAGVIGLEVVANRISLNDRNALGGLDSGTVTILLNRVTKNHDWLDG